MKLAIVLLICSLSFAQSQQDTLALAKEYLSSYDQIQDRAMLSDVEHNIAMGEQLLKLKNRKEPLSLMLGLSYYKMAVDYDRPDTHTSGFEFKGYLVPEKQSEALIKAKGHLQSYTKLHKVNDNDYRTALNLIGEIDERLSSF